MKTVVSAFHSHQAATHLLDATTSSGFDTHSFSIIVPAVTTETPLETVMNDVPGIQACLYRNHLRMGDSLFVAHVSEDDVARLIKLLQMTGGHHIEAFDATDESQERAPILSNKKSVANASGMQR